MATGQPAPSDSPLTGVLRDAPWWTWGAWGLFTTPQQRVEYGRALSGGVASFTEGVGSGVQGAGGFVQGAGSGLAATGTTAGFIAGVGPLLLAGAVVVVGITGLVIVYKLASNPATPAAAAAIAKAAAKGG